MYPKSFIYVLHNLQLHPTGFQSFILCLKIARDFDSLISFGTSSHVFGPLYLIVSRPLFTVLTFGSTHSVLPRCEGSKSFLKGRGQMSCLTLYISTASFCRFHSCIVNDLSFSKSCSNVRLLFLYTTFRALSCSLFILLLRSLL